MLKFEKYNDDAITHFYAGEYDKAMILHNAAIVDAKQKSKKFASSEIISILHTNKGYTLLAMQEYNQAIVQFKLANHFKHNDENDWSLFLCYANLGDWDNAKQYHHSRYGETRSAPTRVQLSKLPIPMVKTLAQLDNKTVLVLNEQGLGDEILFFAGIKKLAKICKAIHLQVYEETELLFLQQLPENVTIFTDRSFDITFVNMFDVYSTSGDMFIYSMSLNEGLGYDEPLIFSNSVIPAGRGFCWQANVASPNSTLRSIDVSYLEQNYKVDGLNQSLQLGAECPDWLTPLPRVNSLHDTARIMANLQSVVTVDTSIAHLAGAMHIPTTLLINQHHDWRWKQLKANGYSLFYPTVKVTKIKL